MKATRRSEQQERARKQAAANLMKKRGGWMAAFGSYMESAFSGVARSVDASMDEDTRSPKVTTPAPCQLGVCSCPYETAAGFPMSLTCWPPHIQELVNVSQAIL